MIGALAIGGVVLLVLLRGLRRTTVALEEGKALAEHQANHDVLTGLANRARFNKRLEEALPRRRATIRASHCWRSISTASSKSTTRSATRRATSCCAR